MTSKTVTQLLADLGVLQSHSRPHQSNDNPFSESNFKTLKYFPTFPRRFAGLVAARGLAGRPRRPHQPGQDRAAAGGALLGAAHAHHCGQVLVRG